jgi:hypothetical protein
LEESGGLRVSPVASQSEIHLGSLVRLCSFLFLTKLALSRAWEEAVMRSNLVWTFSLSDFKSCQAYPCRMSYDILRIVKAIHAE